MILFKAIVASSHSLGKLDKRLLLDFYGLLMQFFAWNRAKTSRSTSHPQMTTKDITASFTFSSGLFKNVLFWKWCQCIKDFIYYIYVWCLLPCEIWNCCERALCGVIWAEVGRGAKNCTWKRVLLPVKCNVFSKVLSKVRPKCMTLTSFLGPDQSLNITHF